MQPVTLTHRSRRGCSTCRRSHAKCDEQRPVCGRCRTKNKTCDYETTLVWPEDSLAKGVRHGRALRKSPNETSVPSVDTSQQALPAGEHRHGPYFLNTTVLDLQEHGRIITSPKRNVATTKGSPLQDRILLSIPSLDEKLTSFYDRILCGAATVEENANGNPFRALIIPMALQSNAVLNALQAVSAKVISLQYPAYRKATVSYHTGALRGLVATIDRINKTNDLLFEACVLCMLLCWFEICCDTDGRWISHLTGLVHLVSCRRDVRAIPPFITNYLLYHFVIARTVCNVEHVEKAIESCIPRHQRSPSAGGLKAEDVSDRTLKNPRIQSYLSSGDCSGTTNTLSQWMAASDLHEINTYPGLSNGLLLLINQVADLEYVYSPWEIAEHNRKTIRIKNLLENYDQYASEGLHPKTTMQVCALGKTYILSCLLYLHHRVSSIRARIFRRTTELDVLFTESEISDLAHRIITQLEDKLSLTRTMANPLWPLFIAACSTDNDDLRVRILACFSQIESDQRYWNVPQVRKLVEKIWRRHDLGTDEPVPSTRKYKKRPKFRRPIDFDGEIYCDWDRVMQLMSNFKWSLT